MWNVTSIDIEEKRGSRKIKKKKKKKKKGKRTRKLDFPYSEPVTYLFCKDASFVLIIKPLYADKESRRFVDYLLILFRCIKKKKKLISFISYTLISRDLLITESSSCCKLKTRISDLTFFWSRNYFSPFFKYDKISSRLISPINYRNLQRNGVRFKKSSALSTLEGRRSATRRRARHKVSRPTRSDGRFIDSHGSDTGRA